MSYYSLPDHIMDVDDPEGSRIIFENLVESNDFHPGAIKWMFTFCILTEAQIRELGEFVQWPEACHYQKLSEDFIRENWDNIFWDELLVENTHDNFYSENLIDTYFKFLFDEKEYKKARGGAFASNPTSWRCTITNIKKALEHCKGCSEQFKEKIRNRYIKKASE